MEPIESHMQRSPQALMAQLEPSDVIAVCTDLMSQFGLATVQVGGKILFQVSGDGGGEWSVDLSQPGGKWSQRAEIGASSLDDVDTVIHATAKSFAALMFAPQMVPGLVAEGAISVSGDHDKLQKLSQLIKSGGTALQLRIRQLMDWKQVKGR